MWINMAFEIFHFSNHTPLFRKSWLSSWMKLQVGKHFTQLYWVLTVKQREFFRTFVSLLTTLIVSKNSKLRWGCLPKMRLQGFPLLQFPEELETRFLHLLRIFLWFSILFPFPLLMPRLMVEYTLSFILKKSTAHTEENVKMATKRHSEYVTNDGKNLCFWVDLRLHIITNSNTHSHAYILQEWHIYIENIIKYYYY